MGRFMSLLLGILLLIIAYNIYSPLIQIPIAPIEILGGIIFVIGIIAFKTSSKLWSIFIILVGIAYGIGNFYTIPGQQYLFAILGILGLLLILKAFKRSGPKPIKMKRQAIRQMSTRQNPQKQPRLKKIKPRKVIIKTETKTSENGRPLTSYHYKLGGLFGSKNWSSSLQGAKETILAKYPNAQIIVR